ncbi:MAG: response regulator [Pseudomonadota bacterium]
MPGMDGFEVCWRLKADPLTRHVPVVMVTAVSGAEERGLEAGAADFLTKPIREASPRARLRSLVRFKMVADEWRLREGTNRQFGINGETSVCADIDAREARVLAIDRHVVEFASDRASALERAARENFDLVIVNLLLRDAEGLRLCAKLRSREATRHTPIMAVVEDGDHDLLAKALDLGVSDYLVSPVDRCELMARCRTQNRRRRYQERLRANYERNLSWC